MIVDDLTRDAPDRHEQCWDALLPRGKAQPAEFRLGGDGAVPASRCHLLADRGGVDECLVLCGEDWSARLTWPSSLPPFHCLSLPRNLDDDCDEP